MRKTLPAFTFVLLVVVQLFCVLPGQGQPTPGPEIIASPPEVTVVASPDNSVGTINLVNSQVETGPPDNLQFLEGEQAFYNGDGVRVTNGGKGKLTLDDGSFMTLFNETELSGVTVSTSPPETDLFLQNEGFLGHVPPGVNHTVDLPNGAQITIRIQITLMSLQIIVCLNSENSSGKLSFSQRARSLPLRTTALGISPLMGC